MYFIVISENFSDTPFVIFVVLSCIWVPTLDEMSGFCNLLKITITIT